MKGYRISKRAWLVATLILFLPGWFVPIIMGEIPPWALIPDLFLSDGHASEAGAMLLMFVALFGIPAVAVGWVLQCFYVMATAKKNVISNDRHSIDKTC